MTQVAPKSELDEMSRSIVRLLKAYRNKTLSPVEVLRQQLDRIETFGKPINAFVYIEPDRAMAAARESEARYVSGQPLGLLDGITFSAKDGLSVAGRPCRKGSKVSSDRPASVTSPVVAECLAAGAVYLGSTTMPEFGIGSITNSPLTGMTTNPWNTSLQAGGSSGGAAASVAAGFNTFALGTDAGGSNRTPAALTGTVGFKPSGGRVPAFPVSGAGALSCPGPIANSARDVAAIMNVIARYDARDQNSLPADGIDYEAGLSTSVAGLSCAYSETLGFAKLVHPEVAARCRDATGRLGELGVAVEDADPKIEDPVSFYVTLMHAGNRYALRNLSTDQKAVLSPSIRRLLEEPAIDIERYLEAQERSRVLSQAMFSFHQKYDIIITPTVAAPAFDADKQCPPEYDRFENKRAWTPFVSIFNLTQQPAISIPIGLTSEGLPIGLQLAAPRFDDALLLRFAHAIQERWPFEQRPGLSAADQRPVVALGDRN